MSAILKQLSFMNHSVSTLLMILDTFFLINFVYILAEHCFANFFYLYEHMAMHEIFCERGCTIVRGCESW